MQTLQRTLLLAVCLIALPHAASADWGRSVDDFGALGNGVADDTAAIQAALNAVAPGGAVLFSAGKTYRIAGTLTGLVPKSDSRLVLHGATLVGVDQPGGRCRIFTLSGKRRITFSGGTFVGSRTGSPEWSFGIHVSDSTDIVIEDGTFEDFYTDAVVVTGNAGSHKIVIRRCRVSNAGRSGVSLISGGDITVEDSLFENTQNTDTNMPRAGLEAEPNTGDSLSGIVVRRCHFRNNQGSGLFFQVGHGTFIRDVTLRDNVSENNGIGGLVLGAVSNAVVHGNRIVGHVNRNGYGIAFTRGASNVVIKSNVLDGNYRGIYVEGSDGVSIAGNSIVGRGAGTGLGQGDDGDGILLRGHTMTVDGVPTTVMSTRASISGNLIRDAAGRGILCSQAAQFEVSNNVVVDSGQHGIQVRYAATDAQIHGNIIAGSGREAPGAYQEVLLSHASSRILVTQNQIRNGGSARTGIALDNVAGTIISENCLLTGPVIPMVASSSVTGTAYDWRNGLAGWNRAESGEGVQFVPQ